jgi:hypothetical protein
MDAVAHVDPRSAVRACFESTFAATIIRVAHDSDIASDAPEVDTSWSLMAGYRSRRRYGTLTIAISPLGARVMAGQPPELSVVARMFDSCSDCREPRGWRATSSTGG